MKVEPYDESMTDLARVQLFSKELFAFGAAASLELGTYSVNSLKNRFIGREYKRLVKTGNSINRSYTEGKPEYIRGIRVPKGLTAQLWSGDTVFSGASVNIVGPA